MAKSKGLLAMGDANNSMDMAGGPTSAELKRELAALKTTAPSKVPIDEIFTREPFVSFLPVKPHRVTPIARDMVKNGFDIKLPIMVIRELGNYYVIDGHTRLVSAKKAKLDYVWVIILDIKVSMFGGDQSAMDKYIIDYMIKVQFYRRNAEEYEYVIMAKKFEKNPNDSRIEREQFAEKFNIKPTSAGKIISVAKRADALSLQKLDEGSTSVNKIWNAMQTVKKEKDNYPELVNAIQDGTISFLEAADHIKEREQQKDVTTEEVVTVDATPAIASPSVSQLVDNTLTGTQPAQTTPAVKPPAPQEPPVVSQATNTPPAVQSTPQQPPVASGSTQETPQAVQQQTPPVVQTPPPVETVSTPPVQTPPVQTPPETDNGDLSLGSLEADEEEMKAIFDEYKIYLNRQKVQTPESVLVNFREHLVALEKLNILDPEIVEYLLDKVDTLED